MRRPTVDPAFTFAIALVMSLVLWWKTLNHLLDGEVDITVAGLRYLAALGLSWCGVYFVASIVAMYASQPRPAPPEPPTPQRRKTDQQQPPEADAPAA